MDLLNPLLLLVAGILAISGLIVAKKPNAKELLDKLVPFQAFIGVGLLVFGLYNLLRSLGSIIDILKFAPLFAIVALGVIFSSILLGFMFGMPQIAKWMPGQGGAEQKGIALTKKLAPFQVIIGLVGIVSALLWLLYRFGILKIVS
jgi:hypothetical protein